jgi:DNA excision repair protein ERCC-2
MIRFQNEQRKLYIGVHDLLDAGPPKGDLYMQVAWSQKKRMKEGQRIHTQYQNAAIQEDISFQREVKISHRILVRNWEVVISGRIDGLRRENEKLVVEEIKSSTLPGHKLQTLTIQDIPNYAKQVQLYLYLLQTSKQEGCVGRLVMISLSDNSEHVLPVEQDFGIEAFIKEQLQWIIEQHEMKLKWMESRKKILEKGLPFAHQKYREGQKTLTNEILSDLRKEKDILVEAATGYGKTAAALYAALVYAYETDRRVYYATARTTQQLMAERTLEAMQKRGLPVRGISIRAKEKICLNDHVLCRPDSCPYSSGYYDKLRRNNLLTNTWDREENQGLLWPEKLTILSEQSMVCPFALTMDLSQHADIIIGDYNYMFDPRIRLQIIDKNPQDWIVIVDECHNLPDRVMGYGSPKISITDVWQTLEATENNLFYQRYATPIRRLFNYMEENIKDLRDPNEIGMPIEEGIDKEEIVEIMVEMEGLALDYAVAKLDSPLFVEEEDKWLTIAYALQSFRNALERAGEESLVIWRKGRADAFLKKKTRRNLRSFPGALFLPKAPFCDSNTGMSLLCRDSSVMLEPIFEKLGGVICMSATLHPEEFYLQLLGFDETNFSFLSYGSMFPLENRNCYVISDVLTQYRYREKQAPKTADRILDIIENCSGNIAVYFSSFAHMSLILPLIHLGERPVIQQTPRMSEEERSDIVETMKRGEGHVLFAVMGGIFSEGVDLPNDALVCAVMVGPALPAATLERRKIQEWNQEKHKSGFLYAWVVPGMARVAQAGGRVIRTPTDRGVVVLIGSRFHTKIYRQCIPQDWHPQVSTEIAEEIRAFFH